jgi:tryptophanyl-tRNA synthetase
MTKEVILTGIRANNDLTIGNYFGAILPIIDMAKKQSEKFQINMFIPDLHSFTTPIDHAKLQEQILHNLRIFVASGLPIDNSDIHLYRQSFIPAHSELTWILDCFTGVGEMNRMTQFKDKSTGLNDERTSMGLFNYPVLMAADVLLYGASYVPVGEDQTQHLEFMRDIGERLNTRFNEELFIIPEPVKKQHEFFGKDQGLRIKDLQDPTKKMSKSDETGKGVIYLGDTPENAAKKIMSAATDSLGKIAFDWDNQPGITNLLQILALTTERPQEDVNKQWEAKTAYGELKHAVAQAMSGFLQGLQGQLALVDDSKIQDKLHQSEAVMNKIANNTLLKVQKAVGLR